MLNPYYIYKYLSLFEPRISLVPREDVLQEIRIALFLSEKGKEFREASKLTQKLLSLYGFSRKKGKDNFQPFYNTRELTEEEQSLLDYIEKLYKQYTAQETCDILQTQCTKEIRNLLSKCFKKNTKGGRRPGSGNKKGIKFCKKCKKSTKNCKCK